MISRLEKGDYDPATFNPTPFAEGTPEWNMAMINIMLKMKERGHKVNEQATDKVNLVFDIIFKF